MEKRIGFISTRFAGTDGVSLESAKWAKVLKDFGCKCFWFAGLLDRPKDISYCVPEAHFAFEENKWLNKRIWGKTKRDRLITRRIHDLADYIRYKLYQFVKHFDINILIIENALTIPMHIPLGVAITEFIAETRLPTISHNHDFYWERSRFSVNPVSDFLDSAFPPRDRIIQHVVINKSAQEEVSWRKGVPVVLIPNVFDFENLPVIDYEYTNNLREDIGLNPGDEMILQPTRVVPRKGIEHSINLVASMKNSKYKLVISHAAGDEGYEYRDMLNDLAKDQGVELLYVSTKIGDVHQQDDQGKKMYTLWDLYPYAKFVSYPSLYEGFGNAFLEAIYFRIPIMVNRYDIFARDIEPKGFKVPVMDGYLTKEIKKEVKKLIEDELYRKKIVDQNYKIAKKFYSFEVLRQKLRNLINNISGLEY